MCMLISTFIVIPDNCRDIEKDRTLSTMPDVCMKDLIHSLPKASERGYVS